MPIRAFNCFWFHFIFLKKLVWTWVCCLHCAFFSILSIYFSLTNCCIFFFLKLFSLIK
jgi:hypothetical protein